MNVRIKNRSTAGKYLANALEHYRNRKDVIVLGIPRGGVPIAREIADHLHATLDVIIARKLGCPQQPELAFGAIASGGEPLLLEHIVNQCGITRSMINTVVAQEKQELQRREHEYRGKKAPLDLKNKTVIIADDGLATGATVRAAIQAVRQHKPASIIVAVPVASASTAMALREIVDDVVCLATPEPFIAVGQHYQEFHQMSDDEVHELLRDARSS